MTKTQIRAAIRACMREPCLPLVNPWNRGNCRCRALGLLVAKRATYDIPGIPAELDAYAKALFAVRNDATETPDEVRHYPPPGWQFGAYDATGDGVPDKVVWHAHTGALLVGLAMTGRARTQTVPIAWALGEAVRVHDGMVWLADKDGDLPNNMCSLLAHVASHLAEPFCQWFARSWAITINNSLLADGDALHTSYWSRNGQWVKRPAESLLVMEAVPYQSINVAYLVRAHECGWVPDVVLEALGRHVLLRISGDTLPYYGWGGVAKAEGVYETYWLWPNLKRWCPALEPHLMRHLERLNADGRLTGPHALMALASVLAG